MNTEILKTCTDKTALSVREVSRITGIKAGTVHVKISRGTFPPPDYRMRGHTPGPRGRAKLYWSAKTIKAFLGL